MMRLVALLALVCVACSAPAPTTTSPEGGAPEASAPETGTDEDTGTPIAMASVSGDVVDSQGAPWAAAKIQVCSETVCTLGNANASGAFHVSVPANDHYHVIAHPPPTDAREGSAGLFVLADLVTADVALGSPVPIFVTGAHATLGAPAAVTNDLTLTANASDVSFYGDAYFSGVSVPQSAWPAFAIAGKTILAMWALNPWGTRTNAQKTIAVSIANHFGLAAGDAASVYAVNETTAALGAASAATVSSDGTTIDGATIDRVTWVVLAH